MLSLRGHQNQQTHCCGSLQTFSIISFFLLILLLFTPQSWASDTVSLKSITEGAKETYQAASDAVGSAAKTAYEAEIEVENVVEGVSDLVKFVFFGIGIFFVVGLVLGAIGWALSGFATVAQYFRRNLSRALARRKKALRRKLSSRKNRNAPRFDGDGPWEQN